MELARVQRDHEGWSASGPHFHVWQEDEVSARSWLEALEGQVPERPAAATETPPRTRASAEHDALDVAIEAFCFPP
jgi:hypothetical protein